MLLDPAQGGTFAGRIVFASLCDKLVDINKKLDFVPQLATAWSWSPNSRTLTLTLRKGVQFQDGQPFDADAVKANLDRYRNAPYSVRKGELKPVSAVEVVDPQTVRLVLSQPVRAADRRALGPRGHDGLAQGDRAARQGFLPSIRSAPVPSASSNAWRRTTSRCSASPATGMPAPSIWIGSSSVRSPIPRVRLVDLRAGQLDMIEEVAPTDAAKHPAGQSAEIRQGDRARLRGDHAEPRQRAGCQHPLGHDAARAGGA